MSNISFEKTKQSVETPVEGVTIDVESTAAVPVSEADKAPATALVPTRPAGGAIAAANASSPHAIFDDNNIGFEDIILPRINIVQKVGDLSNVFPGGHIVLDQSQVLYELEKPGQPRSTPLRLVVIGFKRTSYVEKVQGGAMGLVCRTRDEVVAKGGTLDYKEWQESVKTSEASNGAIKPLRRFDNMTTALVLIEKPESFKDPNHTVFPYRANDKFYVMAFFTMKSSAYNAGAKAIFTFTKTRSFNEDNVSHSDHYFTLGSELKKFPGNVFAYIPDIQPVERVTPEMATLVAKIKGSAN